MSVVLKCSDFYFQTNRIELKKTCNLSTNAQIPIIN